MGTFHESRRLQKESREICTRFVEIEVELACTFYHIATAINNPRADPLNWEKFQRNLGQANKAFESAWRFVHWLEDRGERIPLRLMEKLKELEMALGRAGGH